MSELWEEMTADRKADHLREDLEHMTRTIDNLWRKVDEISRQSESTNKALTAIIDYMKTEFKKLGA